METILQSDIDKGVKLGEIECFTADQIKIFTEENYNEISKSIGGDKYKMLNEVAEEVKSFRPVLVYNDKLEKSIKFIRPCQIRWSESIGDDISKARSGVYMNTELNRKLKRVGKQYEPVIIEKIMETEIEKGGKRAFIGEVREYSGIKYRKVSSTGDSNKDWQRVKEEKKVEGGKEVDLGRKGKLFIADKVIVEKPDISPSGEPMGSAGLGKHEDLESLFEEFKYLNDEPDFDEETNKEGHLILDMISSYVQGNNISKEEFDKIMHSYGLDIDFYGLFQGPIEGEEITSGSKKGADDRASDFRYEDFRRKDIITEDDIKDISVYSLKPEYGGGMAYTVLMKDGSKHSMRMTRHDLAQVAKSGVYDTGYENNMSEKEMAIKKINEGYEEVKLLTDEDMDFSGQEAKIKRLNEEWERLRKIYTEKLKAKTEELSNNIRNFIGLDKSVDVVIENSTIKIGKPGWTMTPIATIDIKENFRFDESKPESEFSFRDIRLKSIDLSDIKDADYSDLIVLGKMAGIMSSPEMLEKLKDISVKSIFERSKVERNEDYIKGRRLRGEIESIESDIKSKKSGKFIADKMKELRTPAGMDVSVVGSLKSYGFYPHAANRMKIVGETPMKYKIVYGLNEDGVLSWRDQDWNIDTVAKDKVESFLRSIGS